MAKYPRLANSINSYEDLKPGDIIHHVYGIRIPFYAGASTVVSAPIPYGQHKNIHDATSCLANSIVFDVRDDKSDYDDMVFASDGNLLPGYSHNDNYWFRSEADALAAVDFLTKCRADDPDELPEPSLSDDYDFEPDWIDWGNDDEAA